jgi:hypothetical protein
MDQRLQKFLTRSFPHSLPFRVGCFCRPPPDHDLVDNRQRHNYKLIASHSKPARRPCSHCLSLSGRHQQSLVSGRQFLSGEPVRRAHLLELAQKCDIVGLKCVLPQATGPRFFIHAMPAKSSRLNHWVAKPPSRRQLTCQVSASTTPWLNKGTAVPVWITHVSYFSLPPSDTVDERRMDAKTRNRHPRPNQKCPRVETLFSHVALCICLGLSGAASSLPWLGTSSMASRHVQTPWF